MTQLRQRMTDDMTVRGLAENTKKSYLNSVAGLARHYRRRPDRISAPEVQDYLSLPFIPSIAETLEFRITTGYPFRHA